MHWLKKIVLLSDLLHFIFDVENYSKKFPHIKSNFQSKIECILKTPFNHFLDALVRTNGTFLGYFPRHYGWSWSLNLDGKSNARILNIETILIFKWSIIFLGEEQWIIFGSTIPPLAAVVQFKKNTNKNVDRIACVFSHTSTWLMMQFCKYLNWFVCKNGQNHQIEKKNE